MEVRAIAAAAEMLVALPVTEAACEREGSLLARVYDEGRASANDDLIEAELLIRGEQVLARV
jgi:hypothetical protein